jgi:dolichol-phosphate mannosyltransferase
VARTVVVIPTYNERENIQRIVPQALAATPCEVLVVDDESPDGTGDVVAEMGTRDPRVHLLRHHPKMGIGPAYKAGFQQALANGFDYIIQMDADLSHPTEMLPKFVELMAEADVVLGSRYIRGITVVNWPIERLLISYFGNWYARRVTGIPVRDATGGFKCWRRDALAAVDLDRVRSNGYAFQIEMNFRAWRRGFRLHEVPIVFVDRDTGESKMNKRIGLEALWICWWLKLGALVGRL